MAVLDYFPRIKAFLAPKPNAQFGTGWESGTYSASHHGYKTMFSVSYDGEKNEGSMGPIKRYWLDHVALRARSWSSYLDSEITQGIINKFAGWIVGPGLKLQSEPEEALLSTEGITIVAEDFSKNVEARFKMYSRSKKTDHAGRENLNQLAHTAYMNAILGGDVLVILRLVDQNVTVELIDGSQVQQPIFSAKFHAEAKERGTVIRQGVERNKKGEQVAYYVRKSFHNFTRIEAKNNGRLTAFLVYGLRYRIDDTRGMPIITAVMESIKKIDRYREASVASAEERAKITYSIEHDLTSTGENPLIDQLRASFDANAKKQTGPIDGEAVRQKVATTTEKQVVNMPIGAKLKTLESKSELQYKEFYNVNINAIASSIGIPPEVALSKYDSNFSASRAALKDWEHTMKVKRADFSFQFYQNIYNFWLEIQVLLNKIQAPGYLEALARGNDMVIESYQNARFVGANVPHIDPVKEVEAERLKLGSGAAHIPLTTVEASTEALGAGDYDSNIEQILREAKRAEELVPEIPQPPATGE